MRINNKAILDAFFSQRKKAMQGGIEDVSSVESLMLDTCKRIEAQSKSNVKTLFALCSTVHHYREIVFFADKPINVDLLGLARNLIMVESERHSEEYGDTVKSLCLFTVGISHIPFIRGHVDEVYTKLMQKDGFSRYFDGLKVAFKLFKQAKELDTPCYPVFMEEFITDESYKVWTNYASDNHLSDLVYFYFLNSDLVFNDIAVLNNSYMKGLEGLADEWRNK